MFLSSTADADDDDNAAAADADVDASTCNDFSFDRRRRRFLVSTRASARIDAAASRLRLVAAALVQNVFSFWPQSFLRP